MFKNTELIVMLTYNDKTVENAFDVFDKCRNSAALCWGMKEKPLDMQSMKALYKYMKECGKTTFLEVVEYTETECILGAEAAVECGADILMGTMYSDKINNMCAKYGIKYMPFVGRVSERPSILEGTAEEMIEQAKKCLEKGVYGFDLLGYRYTGDAPALNRSFISAVPAPVCLAGSINSFQRLDEVKAAAPWAFTIGSAFFDKKFGDDICEQINNVCRYMEK